MSNSFETARQAGTNNAEAFNKISQGLLPGYLGMVFTQLKQDAVEAFLQIEPHHLNPNGFVHGGAMVSLADTIAGYGTVINLPDGSSGFTTIELKTNFLASAKSGKLFGRGTAVHLGRSTHVWDVRLWREGDEKTCAHFRCTQMLFGPKGA